MRKKVICSTGKTMKMTRVAQWLEQKTEKNNILSITIFYRSASLVHFFQTNIFKVEKNIWENGIAVCYHYCFIFFLLRWWLQFLIEREIRRTKNNDISPDINQNFLRTVCYCFLNICKSDKSLNRFTSLTCA